MQRRSFVMAVAAAGGLALGLVFGSAAMDSIASAQTPSPSASASASASTSPVETLRNLFLDNLAEALNIDRATLDAAIVTAGNNTADEAVANGTLTQAQADALKSRIEAGDWGFFGGGRGGKMGGPHLHGVMQSALDAAASTLNLTSDELITQLRSGQTLAEIAEAQGTTEQAVTDAALAAAKTELDQAVADGTLTQAQADEIYARMEQEGTSLFFFRGGRGHGPGGRGRGDGGWPVSPSAPATPDASPSTDTSTDA